MIDYRVIRIKTGESLLCILTEETEQEITVAFPLLITKQVFQVAENVMREVHSTSSFCPFTDDKLFTFKKSEVMFVKSMNHEAVPYYVEMLNKQEEADLLKIYGYDELVKPDDFGDIGDVIEEKSKQLLRNTSEIDDENDEGDNPSHHSGNKTVH